MKLPKVGYLAVHSKTQLVYEIVARNAKTKEYTLQYPPFAEFPDFIVPFHDFKSGKWTYESDRDKWSELLQKIKE